MGRIFDDRGNRMSPSHSRKRAALHRYYVSSALIQGQSQSAGSVARVPAAKIDAVVVDAVHRHIGHDAPIDNTELTVREPLDSFGTMRLRGCLSRTTVGGKVEAKVIAPVLAGCQDRPWNEAQREMP